MDLDDEEHAHLELLQTWTSPRIARRLVPIANAAPVTGTDAGTVAGLRRWARGGWKAALWAWRNATTRKCRSVQLVAVSI